VAWLLLLLLPLPLVLPTLLLLLIMVVVMMPPGARCMLLLPDNRLWVGCEDGRVFVFDAVTEALLTSFKAQGGAVKSLAVLGSKEVWSAAERSLAVHDIESGAIKHQVPLDDNGFVKQLLPWKWGLWVLSFNSLKLLAARSCWEAAQQQVRLPRWQQTVLSTHHYWAGVAAARLMCSLIIRSRVIVKHQSSQLAERGGCGRRQPSELWRSQEHPGALKHPNSDDPAGADTHCV
jgi:hypothetical protein